MSIANIWNRVQQHLVETEGHVATMNLYGEWAPVFPVLIEDEINTKVVVICTPQFVKQVKKTLGIHEAQVKVSDIHILSEKAKTEVEG